MSLFSKRWFQKPIKNQKESGPAALGNSAITSSMSTLAASIVTQAPDPDKLNDQLDLLSLPCGLSAGDLSIALRPISLWPTDLSAEDRLNFCKRVVPVLVRYLRSLYTTSNQDSNISSLYQPGDRSYNWPTASWDLDPSHVDSCFNWVLGIFRGREDGFTQDQRFLTLRVLHKCIASHLPPHCDEQALTIDYFILVRSTFYQLLSKSSQLSLDQTIIDNIAIDWAKFEGSLYNIQINFPSYGSKLYYQMRERSEEASSQLEGIFPFDRAGREVGLSLRNLVDTVNLSPEARSKVNEVLRLQPN